MRKQAEISRDIVTPSADAAFRQKPSNLHLPYLQKNFTLNLTNCFPATIWFDEFINKLRVHVAWALKMRQCRLFPNISGP